eukprot:7419302-Pyramimonas_sp.AAC.1
MLRFAQEARVVPRRPPTLLMKINNDRLATVIRAKLQALTPVVPQIARVSCQQLRSVALRVVTGQARATF